MNAVGASWMAHANAFIQAREDQGPDAGPAGAEEGKLSANWT